MPYHEQHLWDVILPRFLIELTVHVTVIRVTIGQTSPLDEAVVNGHDRVVRFLLQTGFKPDYQTRTKSTMLALAAANGYLDVVKSLLEFHRGLYAGYLSNGNALAAAAENPQEGVLVFLFGEPLRYLGGRNGEGPPGYFYWNLGSAGKSDEGKEVLCRRDSG